MRNPVLVSRREAVRSEIAHAFAVTGHAKPRDIARLVCTTHPGDIHAIGTRLAEDALTDIARHELKKNTQGRDLVSQMQLPGVPQSLAIQLPPAISIPVAGHPGLPDDEDAVIYKPLASATLADVEAHLGLLATQINADTRRYRALKELRDLALAAGATPESCLLAVLGAIEMTMTEVV